RRSPEEHGEMGPFGPFRSPIVAAERQTLSLWTPKRNYHLATYALPCCARWIWGLRSPVCASVRRKRRFQLDGGNLKDCAPLGLVTETTCERDACIPFAQEDVDRLSI